MTGEWIRLTEPVLRKKKTASGVTAPSVKKRSNTEYLELKNALLDLTSYIESISEHSNNELRELTAKIRSLINGQN